MTTDPRMSTTHYLPDLKGVDVGSQAQEDLRFALKVVERYRHTLDPELASRAMDTLRFLTEPGDHEEAGA